MIHYFSGKSRDAAGRSMKVIEVKDIVKKFKDFAAVDGISFEV